MESAESSSPLILTLGYGKRSIDETMGLLKRYGVRFLIDVRSAPWSRYHPDFAQDALKRHVSAHDIVYLFLGEELGGRPNDPACYDAAGKVDYEACTLRPAFREGIGRLRRAWEQGQRVALLCSESRPQDCHRSKSIGPELVREGIEVLHLDEDGTPLSQGDVELRRTGGQLTLEGLPDAKAAKSRRRYGPAEC